MAEQRTDSSVRSGNDIDHAPYHTTRLRECQLAAAELEALPAQAVEIRQPLVTAVEWRVNHEHHQATLPPPQGAPIADFVNRHIDYIDVLSIPVWLSAAVNFQTVIPCHPCPQIALEPLPHGGVILAPDNGIGEFESQQEMFNMGLPAEQLGQLLLERFIHYDSKQYMQLRRIVCEAIVSHAAAQVSQIDNREGAPPGLLKQVRLLWTRFVGREPTTAELNYCKRQILDGRRWIEYAERVGPGFLLVIASRFPGLYRGTSMCDSLARQLMTFLIDNRSDLVAWCRTWGAVLLRVIMRSGVNHDEIGGGEADGGQVEAGIAGGVGQDVHGPWRVRMRRIISQMPQRRSTGSVG